MCGRDGPRSRQKIEKNTGSDFRERSRPRLLSVFSAFRLKRKVLKGWIFRAKNQLQRSSGSDVVSSKVFRSERPARGGTSASGVDLGCCPSLALLGSNERSRKAGFLELKSSFNGAVVRTQCSGRYFEAFVSRKR